MDRGCRERRRAPLFAGAFGAGVLFAAGCLPASADSPNEESVLVIGTRPADVQSISPDTVSASHAWTATDLLGANIPSAFLSDTESSPFQEDLYFRGFDASPVLGTAEGLAVYQGGTRINQRFGDTVLWDMVPSFAINRLDVIPGSDPVFGLNALGGAIAINMKTGFDATPGVQLDLSGGSFGRARLVAQLADQLGNEAYYLGASATDDSGWRRSSESQVYQAYGDFAVRAPHASAGVSLSLAADSLNENGAVPVQDEAVSAFAIPDTARNRDLLLQGRGETKLDSGLDLRGSLYLRSTHIATANGEASDFDACTSNPAILCDDDGDPVETIHGAPIPSSVGGDGTDGVEIVTTTALGGSAEIDGSGSLFGRGNGFAIGNAVDYATTGFGSATLLGNLTFQKGGTTTDPIGIYLGGPEWNIRLRSVNVDDGLYAQDTLALASALSLEVSGRVHFDSIDLTDRYGTALTGNHDYSGINPGAELVWQASDAIRVYTEFEQSNRTPTAAELSCANPSQPCLFPLSFISDPGLKQVVARTVEGGVKGTSTAAPVSLDWSADAYVTRNDNDIIFESSGAFIGSGFFANIGATQRIGAELSADAHWDMFDFRASYAFVNATFESAFTDLSANNPAADANGNIFVVPGDRAPGIPRSTAKIDLSCTPLSGLHLSLGAIVQSSQYLRGDEANLQAQLPGYAVVNAEAAYEIRKDLLLYVEGENILDNRYATFGLHGDPTGDGAFPQFTNPRFIVPAQPFGAWAGIRAEL
ncbi:MAG TPA: TonB-dependent receptor [Rhizomicrobium sp.]|jgi:outer membrane receptor protein involved in Fe transport|nr:TonB-dependent receptor [Rhizomicrobium sp.]